MRSRCAVDTSINGAFFLDQNSYNVSSRVISAFDPTHFVMVGSVQLDNLTGDAFDLIRWGHDGLGFRTAKDFWGNGSGRVVLLRGSFVLPPSSAPNPVPSISALFPASVVSPGSNTWVTITGSNFVPGSIALWSGPARTTGLDSQERLLVPIPADDLVTSRRETLRLNNPAASRRNSTD